MKPGHTTTKRIAVLHGEGDAYTAEIVRAALTRSFTRHQVDACLYHRFDAAVSCPVLINPSDAQTPLLRRTLDSGGKALVLGSMSPGIAEQLGLELQTSAPLAPGLDAADLDPSEPFNTSPARVQYVGDHPVAVAAVIRSRHLCRYDFTDEWNNLGYGRIYAKGSPWGLAVTAMGQDSICIATIQDRAGTILSAYAAVYDTPNGAALWVNRSVGPVDSVEWAMIECFIGAYRSRELSSLPYLREIPLDCAGAVTMRLDCDQAVASADRLFELYASKGLPFSMALSTGLPMTSRDLALLNEIVKRGGSVVSHSVNHHPDWGGSYPVALQEAIASRDWIAEHLKGTRYAVSPFHQNPIHAVTALADAGYRGFVGGSIRDDPEFLLGRAGRVPFVDRAMVSHSQQCMLHGDCYHRYGGTIDPYKESLALHLQAGSFFGFLDHPFSREYQYGWISEEERLSVHEAFIDHMLSLEGLWWCSLEQCLDFLVQRDSCSLGLDDWDNVTFTCNRPLSGRQPAAVWKGEILAPR
jgi:hypothetical protein